jgi:hypothetical protein
MAPSLWGKASEVAYQYFNDGMLNEPGFEFFRYCKGNWKLMRWATKAYASWAHNHMKSSDTGNSKSSHATKRKCAILNDPSLIRLDDNQDPYIATAAPPPLDSAPINNILSSLEPSTSTSLPIQVCSHQT